MERKLGSLQLNGCRFANSTSWLSMISMTYEVSTSPREASNWSRPDFAFGFTRDSGQRRLEKRGSYVEQVAYSSLHAKVGTKLSWLDRRELKAGIKMWRPKADGRSGLI
ncbi:hypothetical protein CLCR_03198 [Cladophialophora carrionii]|uniref:Uncharacterized protein n=1 Tax=Cladophialophora carrionii TaxID=86049 RepID=A0A1C1D1R3_9EURO|nr:hypothetical protein CLCR_03198 [Cladophialophora carrionii]